MTTVVDIANRALVAAGIPKKLNSLTQDSTEAATINSIINVLRDDLIRVAPWNCATKYFPLVYVSSMPGTPENPSPGPPNWQPGLPAPPWVYEYQYPVDCLRARYIIPQYTTQNGGQPIFPAGVVNGTTFTGWQGPALKFTVSTDQFFAATAATPVNQGAGYLVGDLITLTQPNFSFAQGGAPFTMPVGAPAVLQVTGATAGAITSVAVVNQVLGELSPLGGSYYQVPTNPIAQASTNGLGTGATFNLTFGSQAPQRVILTNMEFGILCYNVQLTDPNVMDPHFQDAWINLIASRVSFMLNGDIPRANALIMQANSLIGEARKSDGNEGLTVNDVTPDWIRVRGVWGGPNWEFSPNMDFDWGSFYSPY